MKWLVIGVGNPLRGDDGVGREIADRIAEQGWPDVEVRSIQQLTPELAEEVARAAGVIFVDAAASQPPGQVNCGRIVANFMSVPFSHQLDPHSILDLAGALYGQCPRAWLVTVGAATFELGVGLSPAVTAAVAEALRRVCELVE